MNTPGQAAEPSAHVAAVEFVQPAPSESVIRNTTGHIDLVWAVTPLAEGETPAYELQGARSSDFAEPIDYYSGLDERTFLSGLAEGEYFFRVRALDAESRPGEWSEVLTVEVDYVARWQVFLLMLVGLVCLTVTIGIIVRGSMRSQGSSKKEF